MHIHNYFENERSEDGRKRICKSRGAGGGNGRNETEEAFPSA